MALEQSQIFEDEFPLIRSCAALNEIRLAEEIKDLRIEVQDGAVLHAHRIILAARIPSLRASLRGQQHTDNSVLRWPTVPLSIATTLINYLYTGQMKITQVNVRGISMLAGMFNLPVLENWGVKFLASRLTLETLATTWDFARSLNNAPLMDVCINLMQDQFQDFVQTDLFVRLPADTLLNLLRNDDLPVDSEENVFGAISRWVCPCKEVDQERLELHAPTMLKEVRWCQTTVEFREHMVENHQIFKKSNECVRLMLQFEQWMIHPEKNNRLCPFNPRSRPPQPIVIFGKDKNRDSWSVLRFDSDLQREEKIADMKKREFATYSVVGGSVFAIGGRTSQEEYSRSVKEFLVRERSWRDRAPLAVGRFTHAATVIKVGGEKMLIGVFGGYNGARLSSCEIYDVGQNRWCTVPDLREKRGWGPAAACVPGDNRIFVFGGLNDSSLLASVEFCQLRADWQQGASAATSTDFWQSAAPMRIARYGLAATPLRGKIIVAGGRDCKSLNAVELFTPPDAASPVGQWTQLAEMQGPRYYFTLLTSANTVYALGNNDGPHNTVEAFTPPADVAGSGNDLTSWSWSTKNPVESLGRIWGAASLRI